MIVIKNDGQIKDKKPPYENYFAKQRWATNVTLRVLLRSFYLHLGHVIYTGDTGLDMVMARAGLWMLRVMHSNNIVYLLWSIRQRWATSVILRVLLRGLYLYLGHLVYTGDFGLGMVMTRVGLWMPRVMIRNNNLTSVSTQGELFRYILETKEISV